MKKSIAILCMLCLAVSLVSVSADGAAPRFRFQLTVAVSFQGQEAVIRAQFMNLQNVGGAVEAELRDGEGTVLATRKFSNSDMQNMRFTVPDDWIGAKYLSIWVEGEKVSQEDLFLAVDILNNRAIRQVDVSTPRMSITIDAAYGDTNTNELLDLLDTFGVKVTFFVTGQWAKYFPEHIQEIVSRGHEIANHSFFHPRMTEQSYDRVLREIVNTNDRIVEACGVQPVLFRPPFGDTNHLVRCISRAAGCEHIMWTIDSHDWDDNYDMDRIISRVTYNIQPGYIILFHNSGRYTPDVLREVIPYYQSLGYELVTVSTLLSEGEYTVNQDGLVEFAQE